MKSNLHSQVENSRTQEEDRTQSNLEKQRLRAIEHAIERLPPQQSQELRENRWLLSEAAVHRDQIKILYSQVQNLERRNLDLMNVVYTKRMARLGMLMKSGKPVEASEIGKAPMSANAGGSGEKDIRRLSSSEAKDLLSKKIQEENLKHINDLARKATPNNRSGLSSRN